MNDIDIELRKVHELLEENSKNNSKGIFGLEEMGFSKKDLSKPLTLGKYEYSKEFEKGNLKVIVSFIDRDRPFDVRPDGVEVTVKKNEKVIKTYKWIEAY